MARKSRKNLSPETVERSPAKAQKKYVAGVYLRVSSGEQKGDSIKNQRQIAENYVMSQPDIDLGKIYVDEGVSSFAKSRPGFEGMLSDIKVGNINCIIVKDISRFSRDYLEAGDLTQHLFPSMGVRFVSVNDNFDSLYDDATHLKTVLQALLAYLYSDILSRKIKSIVNMKQAIGSYTPSQLPFGYKKVRSEYGIQWEADDSTAPIVLRIFENASSGLSPYFIASKLNEEEIPSPGSKLWTSNSVMRVLRNEAYTGVFITGKMESDMTGERKVRTIPSKLWIRHNGHHSPVINEKLFKSVQKIINARRAPTLKRGQSAEDFFGGKLYCGLCGRKLKRKYSTNRSVYYICPRRDESASACSNKAQSEKKLKEKVFSALSQIAAERKKLYCKAVEYENSPYYLSRVSEQARLLKQYKSEIDRNIALVKQAYEMMVGDHTASPTDMHEMMIYLRRSREALEKHIANILQEQDDYHRNESSSAPKYDICKKVDGSTKLTEAMLSNIETIYIDPDSTRLVLK